MTATATDADSASATVSGGGVFNGNFDKTQASNAPTVQAYFESSDTVNVGGSVSVKADSVSAESHATAKAFGGGAIAVGIPDATATTQPTVTAYFGSSSSITAGGNISLNSEELSQATPTVQALTDDIQDIYTDSDTVTGTVPDSIVFPTTGCKPETLVLYVAGSPAIQTPNGNLQTSEPLYPFPLITRTYKVIAIDADTLQFGDIFQAQLTSNGLDPFASSAGVDPTNNIINFGAPDYFQDGDAVQYFNVQGNSAIGLNTGTTYYVRPVTPSSVELYTSNAAATATVTFDPTQIASNVIKNATGSLSAGEAVTVLPENSPFLFQTSNVDVNTSNGNADVTHTTFSSVLRIHSTTENRSTTRPTARRWSSMVHITRRARWRGNRNDLLCGGEQHEQERANVLLHPARELPRWFGHRDRQHERSVRRGRAGAGRCPERPAARHTTIPPCPAASN